MFENLKEIGLEYAVIYKIAKTSDVKPFYLESLIKSSKINLKKF